MDISTITADVWIENENELIQRLQEHTNWESIPFLNYNEVQNLQDRKLVKFRGMVQDMFNPEYFYEQYEVVDQTTKVKSLRNGKFSDITYCKDAETINYDSPDNITKERHTLVVITTPGLNEWVHNIEKTKYTIASPSSRLTQVISKKRSLEPLEEMETESIENSTSDNKKQCTSEAPTNIKHVSREHLLNFPFREQHGKVCHVKLYKDSEKIKLNDVVEVVGFLSVDPILTDFNCEDDCVNEMEIQTHNPPPSLIPRVHCVSIKKVPHSNPLLDANVLNADRIRYIKKDLHIVLTQLLLGDTLAAEYLIYHLISKVYVRNDLLPLGKFALNILNVPVTDVPDFGKHLSEFIALMVSTSYYLPMTLENMNELSFTPKKDYECDRLTSGLLQLSSNTHLILDETKLAPGRLNESGVKAISALSNTIKNQKIAYDFNYYPVEFDCDIAFLILSEGKTLLSSDFYVRLNPDNTFVKTYQEILETVKILLKPELLNDIRVYLTQMRHSDFQLNDDVHQLVQNEFVRLRQSQSITADDLHQLLVLARWICLSEGKTHLDADSWKRACELEEQRKKNLV
ncbi:hypothetical protein RN001_009556 [Aquatica leii]|uniref:Mini-chromosome maintenance complex-binding protein n=1 Tax=Aquatica leii TaxID=1421715 RepID=A0AAN7SPZ8_9COLE|nr:hypothetical protein RN001_009556 [Aquatica leii]